MERRRSMLVLTTAAAIGLARAPAMGVVVGGVDYVSIRPLKLVIVDKLTSASSAKAVYVAKDTRITKGSGTNPATIESRLTVYGGGNPAVFWTFPGTWLVNDDDVAKYVDESAPSGGATKVSVIKPGKLVKNVARSLGDIPIDISSPPSASWSDPIEHTVHQGVLTDYSLDNAGEMIHLCGAFPSSTCSHKSIAGGTGWKLVCRNGVEADCPTNPCVCCTVCGAFVD